MAKKKTLQTVTVKKSLAPTRAKAKRIVRKMKKRTYTSRETPNQWRFRQRPPDCFKKEGYFAKCFDKGGVSQGVCLVFGELKRGAKRRKACR